MEHQAVGMATVEAVERTGWTRAGSLPAASVLLPSRADSSLPQCPGCFL